MKGLCATVASGRGRGAPKGGRRIHLLRLKMTGLVEERGK